MTDKKPQEEHPATPSWLNEIIEKDWQFHLKASRRLGRRVRKWLIRWCKNFLIQNDDRAWVKVEIEENAEHYNVCDAHVTTNLYMLRNDGIVETQATDALWQWAGVIKYGVPPGSWVRVTRTGKVYRNKKKPEPADGD